MRLLHISATTRGLASNTQRISNVLLQALHEKYGDLDVDTLDLFQADLPAVTGSNIESKYKLMTGQSLGNSEQSSWQHIEQTIQQFLDADVYVLSVPMWNLSIPYVLKYYIDVIVQPGYLFRYTREGYPEGLVKGKKMICVTSRGGDYSSGPMQAFDFMEGYLRSIFGFVGITDVHFINAQPMDVSPELRQMALQKAFEEAHTYVKNIKWQATSLAA